MDGLLTAMEQRRCGNLLHVCGSPEETAMGKNKAKAQTHLPSVGRSTTNPTKARGAVSGKTTSWMCASDEAEACRTDGSKKMASDRSGVFNMYCGDDMVGSSVSSVPSLPPTFGLRRRRLGASPLSAAAATAGTINPQVPSQSSPPLPLSSSSFNGIPRSTPSSSLAVRTTCNGAVGSTFPSVLCSLRRGGGGGMGGGRGSIGGMSVTLPPSRDASGSGVELGGKTGSLSGHRGFSSDGRRKGNRGGGTGGAPLSSRPCRPDYEASLVLVDRSFRLMALGILCSFIFLLALCYLMVPPENVLRTEGTERTAPTLAFFVLLVLVLSKAMSLVFRKGARRALSGIMVGGLAVQLVALSADFVMAFLPAPVIVDRVTGVRVHLTRWCEWTPLAFIMTFMTECIDLQVVAGGPRGLRVPIMVAACQGLSTACGLLFPFCPGPISWMVVMAVSCLLYFVMFFRLEHKRRAFRSVRRGNTVDEVELYNSSRLSLQLLFTCTVMWTILVVSYFFSSAAPALAPEGSFLKDSSLTMVSECFMDVLLKVLYMGIIIEVHDTVFDDGARAERRLNELRRMMSVVWGSSSDVIMISVKGMRGNVTTMISPTYLSFYKGDTAAVAAEAPGVESRGSAGGGGGCGSSSGRDNAPFFPGLDASNPKALVFEFSPQQYERDGKLPLSAVVSRPMRQQAAMRCARSARGGRGGGLGAHMLSALFPFGVGGGVSGGEESSGPDSRTDQPLSPPGVETMNADGALSPGELSSLAGLLCRAWKEGQCGEVLLLHELLDCKSSIQCEAKVTRLKPNALIVVVRDTTERTRRFEAEKQFVFESMARQKDLEANRFTRHEVKNGLLAAIGLCDSLKETFLEEMRRRGLEEDVKDEITVGQTRQRRWSGLDPPWHGCGGGGNKGNVLAERVNRFDSTQCINELDKTLHEVMETVLADAMARDVIHEVYEPRMEQVDVCAVLSRQVRGYKVQRERFPFITYPSPLPNFWFDPQLLKYIHRNAISNACKYGKKGGDIITEVRYDEAAGMLEMNVTNLPGKFYNKILLLGSAAAEAVFEKGKRIHPYLKGSGSKYSDGGATRLHSSGDGAWIMRKCAKMLGGECSIRFEPNRTVFSLQCPATPSTNLSGFAGGVGEAGAANGRIFELPRGMWGIAIDDSKIQRKLLQRFLVFTGIHQERCIVLGKDTQEIQGFVDFVVDFMDQHPDDFFFLIADENLDIIDDQMRHLTVSGSSSIESIRKRILPDQERRLLALVRSANDSSNDIAIYNSRAHGFLPKAPLQNRERVLETVGSLWEKRYPHTLTGAIWGTSAVTAGASWQSSRAEDNNNRISSSASGEESDDIISPEQLMQTVDEIDSLCNQPDSKLTENWPMIWKKLHSLKGDLLTLEDNGNTLKPAINSINFLRGPTVPKDFVARWMVIRSLAVSVTEVRQLV